MRRVLTLVLLALCLSTAHPIARQSVRPPAIVVKAARMFDGRSDSIIADAVIVVEGTSITAAGSRLAVPPGSSVIDLGDVTLLPGFIDAHTHLTDESSDDWNADTVSRAAAHASPKRRFAPSQFARAYAAGRLHDGPRRRARATTSTSACAMPFAPASFPGPRMLVAVHALGARGGHCDNTGYPLPAVRPGAAASQTESPAARTSSATPSAFR